MLAVSQTARLNRHVWVWQGSVIYRFGREAPYLGLAMNQCVLPNQMKIILISRNKKKKSSEQMNGVKKYNLGMIA